MYDRSGTAKITEVMAALVFASLAFLAGLYLGKIQEQKRRLQAIDKAAAHSLRTIEERYTEPNYLSPDKWFGKITTIKLIGPKTSRIDLDIIVQIESSGDAKAHNKETGARGICQIQEATWNECVELMGVDWDYWEDCNSPLMNKSVAMFYVNNRIPIMLKYYGIPDTVDTRLASYNWGIGNVKRTYKEYGHLTIALPNETKDYINRYWSQYKQ